MWFDGGGTMAKRDNHYDAAFEAWLRCLRVPYVAVDEAHRSAAPLCAIAERTIKSLDCIVYPLSARWGTVSIPIARFRALARPVREFFSVPLPRGAGAA